MRQSRPDSGVGVQSTVLETCEVVSSSLGSGAVERTQKNNAAAAGQFMCDLSTQRTTIQANNPEVNNPHPLRQAIPYGHKGGPKDKVTDE
jgi:hypothetical protein